MKQIVFLILTAFVLFSCGSPKKTEPKSTLQNVRYTAFVDPFIGTAEHGHVYPGATVPFGMVQLSPDNGTQGWDWCGGYNWISDSIVGFSHTHLSGTGIGDLADILLMPTTLEVTEQPTAKNNQFVMRYRSSFSHDNESAEPGYYTVLLNDTKINVELTATQRCGIHRYTFPKNERANLILDLGFAINWDKAVSSSIKKIDEQTFVGYRKSTGWATDQRVYFAMKFSKPIKAVNYFADGVAAQGDSIQHPFAKAAFQFDNTTDNQLIVSVGISSASIDGALKNLETELNGKDFEALRKQASDLWETELSKIKVETNDSISRTIFYTALYHTMLAPVMFSDANGEYKGLDGNVHKTNGFERYTVFSLWDTFRAHLPLFTIIEPELTNDFIQSFLTIEKEGGYLPIWELVGNETNTMIGYHSIPPIVDAYLKKIGTFNADTAYEAMKRTATRDFRGLKYVMKQGYIPADKENRSVSMALEYAYNDWCIAQMAKAMGKTADYEEYMKRASYYKNYFDAKTGFMRGKNANGSWKTPFDPQFSNHENDVYIEGNAWQWSWFVPHDPQGLIELHGGNDAFCTKLDSMFTLSSEIKGEAASPDISGLIGQYAHGNEPSHHIIYFYNYAGKPQRTQELARQIMQTQYKATPAGICGNEDCGQMSAWYVFNAMGLYPMNPAGGVYDFGSPLFDKVTIEMGNGKTFTIEAKNVSAENKYIKSVELNGKKVDVLHITHSDIAAGGILKFEMSNTL